MTKLEYLILSKFISKRYSKDESAEIRDDAQKEFSQHQAIQGRVQHDECILGISTSNLPATHFVGGERKSEM